jgi:uncharacterized protein YdaU (DUF1376 family)
MIFYSRFPGDYLKKTAHLSLVEHGAFCVLLDSYYGSETPYPNDLDTLYRICRAMSYSEKKAVRSIVEQFFYVAKDGLLHNEKADKVIAHALPRIEAARVNGGKGGRPKKIQIDAQENLMEEVLETHLENPVGYFRDTQ